MNFAEIIVLKDLTVFNNNASINRTLDRHVPRVPAKTGLCVVRVKGIVICATDEADTQVTILKVLGA